MPKQGFALTAVNGVSGFPRGLLTEEVETEIQ